MRRVATWVCLLLGIMNLAPPALSSEDEWVFVSVPDFLNADVADLSTAPGWDGGEQSQQPSQLAAVNQWLDAIAAEHPEFVLVAGDLIMGHWDQDTGNRGLFGPVSTLDEKRAAITAAGDVVYPQWLERFSERGLVVHAAVGDHEIGDDPWRLPLVDTYRAAFAKYLTQGRYSEAHGGTAYAFQHRNLQVVTVDVFSLVDGQIHADVSGDQLDWLDSVLRKSTADHVIVQGHTPVLGPARRRHSSGLMLENGPSSEFWETLCRHDVDLYFAGEFHDLTVNEGCVTQVVHGGNINFEGDTNYLVVTVGDDALDLVAKVADVTPSGDQRVYQTGITRPYANITLGEFLVKGQAHYDGVWQGTGELQPLSTFDAVVIWSAWKFSRSSVAVTSLLVLASVPTGLLLAIRRRRSHEDL